MTLATVRKKISPILEQHRVKRASVFGSFATGHQKAHSDLDLIVQFSEKCSLLHLASLKVALEDALKRKVDLLTPKSIRKELKKHIARKMVKIL